MAIAAVFLDLDGTLLNDQKEVSERNLQTLQAASERGILLVPTTGRFYHSIHAAVRALPGARYAITCNGAQIYDSGEDRVLARREIPLERALEVLPYLESLPALCDCQLEDRSYVADGYLEAMEYFIPEAGTRELLRRLRQPVGDLSAFLRKRGSAVQKFQLFFRDPDARRAAMEDLPRRFPELVLSAAASDNLELNAAGATKGSGLLTLCGLLGVDPADTVAFGDCTNDLSMLRAAGLGIAMGNALPEVKAAADQVTLSNEEDGVAAALEVLLGL